MTIIATKNSIHVISPARIVDDSKETAWAEKIIHADPDIKWVLGNYVEADNANSNGHYFPLDQLENAKTSIMFKPLNMLHAQRKPVGAFVAAEMMYPTDSAAEEGQKPYVEALAAFWRHIFQDEYEIVQRAFDEGSLYFSMEAVPKSLICMEDDLEFPYAGRQHESYCDHMRENPVASRKLMEPHFKGGAMIVPPVKPGWTSADVKEVSRILTQELEAAETVYEDIKTNLPHLSPKEWEGLMIGLMVDAFGDSEVERKMFQAAGQIPKDQVSYREASDENTCANCSHSTFIGDGGGCELIAGDIEKTYVCDLHSKAPTSVVVEKWPRYSMDVQIARKFSADERKKAADKGHAMSDGSFPIENEKDLKNAISLAGNASDPEAAKKHIKKRAKALGLYDMIPDTWN